MVAWRMRRRTENGLTPEEEEEEGAPLIWAPFSLSLPLFRPCFDSSSLLFLPSTWLPFPSLRQSGMGLSPSFLLPPLPAPGIQRRGNEKKPGRNGEREKKGHEVAMSIELTSRGWVECISTAHVLRFIVDYVNFL